MAGIRSNRMGLPGIGASTQASAGLVSDDGDIRYKPGGGRISGTKTRDAFNSDDITIIRIGTLMSHYVTDDTYAPWIIGVTTGALGAAGTSITVSPASALELVRRVGATGNLTLSGPPAANGTAVQVTTAYSAVNTSTGVITITATGVAFVAGSIVGDTTYLLPTTFVGDDNPILMPTTGDVDWPRIPMACVINTAKLLNFPSDTGLRTLIENSMSTLAGNKFVFRYRI